MLVLVLVLVLLLLILSVLLLLLLVLVLVLLVLPVLLVLLVAEGRSVVHEHVEAREARRVAAPPHIPQPHRPVRRARREKELRGGRPVQRPDGGSVAAEPVRRGPRPQVAQPHETVLHHAAANAAAANRTTTTATTTTDDRGGRAAAAAAAAVVVVVNVGVVRPAVVVAADGDEAVRGTGPEAGEGRHARGVGVAAAAHLRYGLERVGVPELDAPVVAGRDERARVDGVPLHARHGEGVPPRRQ